MKNVFSITPPSVMLSKLNVNLSSLHFIAYYTNTVMMYKHFALKVLCAIFWEDLLQYNIDNYVYKNFT